MRVCVCVFFFLCFKKAAYAASKAGVVGMMLPLARSCFCILILFVLSYLFGNREFASLGIRVCTIAPGSFSIFRHFFF